MKNNSSSTYDSFFIWSVPHLVIFELWLVFSSLTIISISSLVILNNFGNIRRSRAALLFTTVSISDVGVGLVSQPLRGLHAACIDYVNCSRVVYTIIIFFSVFPCTFSHITTAVIAIDRLLIITKQLHYENVITKRRLSIVVAVFFILSTGYCLGLTHALMYSDVNSVISIITITKYVNFAINVIIPSIVTVAYIYILCFARRHSNVVSHYKHSRNKVNKKLTKTIMCLAIYQTICGVPYLVFRVTDMLGKQYMQNHTYLSFWFVAFSDSQCFVNGIILLLKQEKSTKTIMEKKITDAPVRNMPKERCVVR